MTSDQFWMMEAITGESALKVETTALASGAFVSVASIGDRSQRVESLSPGTAAHLAINALFATATPSDRRLYGVPASVAMLRASGIEPRPDHPSLYDAKLHNARGRREEVRMTGPGAAGRDLTDDEQAFCQSTDVLDTLAAANGGRL